MINPVGHFYQVVDYLSGDGSRPAFHGNAFPVIVLKQHELLIDVIWTHPSITCIDKGDVKVKAPSPFGSLIAMCWYRQTVSRFRTLLRPIGRLDSYEFDLVMRASVSQEAMSPSSKAMAEFRNRIVERTSMLTTLALEDA